MRFAVRLPYDVTIYEGEKKRGDAFERTVPHTAPVNREL